MLDTQSLEWRIACERLKDEAVTLERQCEAILGQFDGLERAPTDAEREARREAYVENRSRLYNLQCELDSLTRRVQAYEH
jgi:hypothetical protein